MYKKHDIYTLLNLTPDSSAETVKKTFRAFAKSNHPDFFPGDPEKEERFKTVNAAYQGWKLIQRTAEQIRRLRRDTGGCPAYAAQGRQQRTHHINCWA